MSRELPVGIEDPGGRSRHVSSRLLAIIFLGFLLLQPVTQLHRPLTGDAWFQLAAAVAMTALVCWRGARADLDEPGQLGIIPVVVLALGIALFAAGGIGWLASLAVGAGICGRLSRAPFWPFTGAAACAVTGLVVATVHRYPSGEIFSAIVMAPLAAFLGYGVARRVETLNMLRRTRAELARAAAAEERLRIARDLHDLLGHSLSLITLKAELAGRVIGADPDRAAREIAELEAVARQSLSDVREAVAGFRQPDLAGELVAARQLLDAAGVSSRITAPEVPGLAHDVDAALAWAVREGATNVVRHSRATQVAITVTTGPDVAVAEITDDGPPPESLLPAADGWHGSGLAGLAERVSDLGGELAAGTVQPHGFQLRVVVPLGTHAS